MFTGIIRHLGQVKSNSKTNAGMYLVVSTALAASINEGDSLSVNGACLTVLETTKQTATFRLMTETIKRTNLGQLKSASLVNLEKPLTPVQSIDGHFVMGHIDSLATITDIKTVNKDKIITFRIPVDLMPYLVPKGSVALDGVSMTVVDVNENNFTVSMMPYTLDHTLFGQVATGYQANLEVDVLGKYVARLLRQPLPK